MYRFIVEKLTLLAWNMNQKPANWQTVLESGVDAAMLQEAKVPLEELKSKFIADWEGEWAETILPWRAVAAGIAASEKIEFIPIKTQFLGGNNPDALMVSRPGSLAVALMRTRETGEEIFIVSMYSTWIKADRPVTNMLEYIANIQFITTATSGEKLRKISRMGLIHFFSRNS